MVHDPFSFLFRPKSIALIGGSRRPGSLGHVLARNLIMAGFDGPIMPVHPKAEAIAGIRAYPTVDDLPQVPDLAVIAVPPEAAISAVRDLNARGCPVAIVISAGFGEGVIAGGQERMVALKEAAGEMRLVGPNVLGVVVPDWGLNASFVQAMPTAGDLALVSQSGAVIASVLDWAVPRGIGFSHLLSVGDSVDLGFAEMLDALTHDQNVRAILLYIESITNARTFLSAARAAARVKPVIAIKSGRSATGAAAAASHTGALAGVDAVYDAAFRRAGMMRVKEMQQLFDAAEILASTTWPKGERLSIVTNGGGMGVMAADELEELGGSLALLQPETIEKLDAVLPGTWSQANPVDIIGDADGQRYADALAAVMTDNATDAVLVINCPTAIADSVEAAQGVIDFVGEAPSKPVFATWLGEQTAGVARAHLRKAHIPAYGTPERAVRGFMNLVEYSRNQRDLLETPLAAPDEGPHGKTKSRDIIQRALDDGRAWLYEHEAKSVLRAYGIEAIETQIASSPQEAKSAAAQMTGPFAVKILSRDITHKSDVGGVVLDVLTPADVERVTAVMLDRLATLQPDAKLEGVAVQPMVAMPGAHELIIGMQEDPIFGPVILFGKGGKAVEVIEDTATGLAPLNTALAQRLIQQTDVYRLLKGYRDEKPAALPKIVDALLQVSQLAVDLPEVVELDINPLLVDHTGCVAVDARIRVKQPLMNAPDRIAIAPYPSNLTRLLDLKDGMEITVQPARPADAEALLTMIECSDAQDIFCRCFEPFLDRPETMAQRMTLLDYSREMTLLAMLDDTVIACLNIILDVSMKEADFGIVVHRDYKGRGLGRVMMQYGLEVAETHFAAQSISGLVHHQNTHMMTLGKQLGFVVEDQKDEELCRLLRFF